jgi:two-component system OmpR family response regulator
MSKIVVVDDNEVVRVTAKALFEADGHDVQTVESAIGLSALVTRSRPDLVMVDFNMPGISGDKVIELIRKHAKHNCAIVLLSEMPTAELAAIAAHSGADDFVQKSGGPASIRACVQRVLSRQRNGQEKASL